MRSKADLGTKFAHKTPEILMKRFIPLSCVLLLSTSALAACGSDDNTDNATTLPECPVNALESVTSPVDITLWHSYVGPLKATLESIAASYNASQSKVRVKVENQGKSYEDLLRKYQQAVPSKSLPALSIGEDIDTRYMAASGTVIPAQACMDADPDPRAQLSDVLPAIKSYYTVDKTLYPVSFNSSTVMQFYNKAHFVAAGLDPEKPPTTLDEMYQTAKKLKEWKPSNKPLVMKMDSWFIEHWLNGAGVALVNNDNGHSGQATETNFNNETTKKIFNWLVKMKSEGLLDAVPSTDSQIDHYLAVATQASSILLETSASITTINGVLDGTFKAADLGQQDNPNVSKYNGIKIDLDVGVAPNIGVDGPAVGQVGGGAWYLTNTGSPQVQAAGWDFAKYYNDAQQQIRWTTEGSYLPILTSAAQNPELNKIFTETRKGKWLKTAFDSMSKIPASFPGAQMGPFTKYRESVKHALEAITIGDGTASVDEALTKAASEMNAEFVTFNESV